MENDYFKQEEYRKYKKEIDDSTHIKEKVKVLCIGLILGIIYDVLFTGKFVGISAPIFTIIFIWVAIWSTSSKINLSKKLNWIFLILIILLSSTYAIYTNHLLRFLNMIIIPLLISGYILSIRYESIKEIRVSFLKKILSRLIIEPLENFDKGAKFSKDILQTKEQNKENKNRKAIVRGLLISLPLLFIIMTLLTSADAMFSYHITNIVNKFDHISIDKFVQHTVTILIVAIYSIGFLWSFKYKEKQDNETDTGIKYKWNAITVLTVLFSISIVYLLFSIVQISYLYGGSAKVIESGYTYAEYARRGFFELVAVTLINFTILLASIKLTKVDGTKILNTLKVTYSLLIIFTFNMIISAFYKMSLYEKAFGYTTLRLLVQIFIVYLGVLLCIVIFKVWRKNTRALNLALIVSMIFYIGINFANIDKIIVKNNIDRYFKTGDIDIYYITMLSLDSISEMDRLLEMKEDELLKNPYVNIKLYVEDENAEYIHIKDFVKNYINRVQNNIKHKNSKWYEYNYHRNKMKKLNMIDTK